MTNIDTSNLTYLSTFTTLEERPIYLALTGVTWGLGAILGPVVGGGFSASAATWRWAVSAYPLLQPKHN